MSYDVSRLLNNLPILVLVNVVVLVSGLLLGRLPSAAYLVRAMGAAALVFSAFGGAFALIGYLLHSGDQGCGLICPLTVYLIGGYGLQLLGVLVGLFACGIALAYVIRGRDGSGLALVALGSCLPLVLLEGYALVSYSGMMPYPWPQTWGVAIGATWSALAVVQALVLLAASRRGVPRALPAPA